jgi:ABC-type lipoprotein release transport system permease subunit
VVVGKSVRRDMGLGVGDTLALGHKRWRVTGVMEADGAGFEGELWCDLPELLDQFRRVGRYSSVVLRAADPAAAAALAGRLAQSRHLGVEAMTETEYYRKQAEGTRLIQNAAWVIACFVSIGAACGVMNTMFAAIAQRSKDIALLRILGFRPVHILASFLVEAVLIAAAGGALGLALGSASNGLTQTAGLGGDSPSPGARQIDFAFRVDGTVVAVAATFTVSLGLVGGLLPALSAMRVKPLEGLR